MDEFQLEDGSNDKAYFTMVPNIVLNHSSAVDQALYMQMKRFAGEKSGGGYCTASKRTLMTKLGVGIKALNASIEYLVEHKWINLAGTRKVMTDGGFQDIQIFRVNDIWKLNTEHYKGASESTPLHEGVAESAQGALERRKGVAESATTKNYKTIRTLSGETPRVVEDFPEREGKLKAQPKHPHAKSVFGLWGKYPRNWDLNTTQLRAAENLYEERGIEDVSSFLEWYAKHKNDDFCPQVSSPYDLDSKWDKLGAFYDKQHA